MWGKDHKTPEVITGFGPNRQVDREVCTNRYGLTNINAPESDGNRGDVRGDVHDDVRDDIHDDGHGDVT